MATHYEQLTTVTSWIRGHSDAVYTYTHTSVPVQCSAHHKHLDPQRVGHAEGYQGHHDTSNGKMNELSASWPWSNGASCATTLAIFIFNVIMNISTWCIIPAVPVAAASEHHVLRVYVINRGRLDLLT